MCVCLRKLQFTIKICPKQVLIVNILVFCNILFLSYHSSENERNDYRGKNSLKNTLY